MRVTQKKDYPDQGQGSPLQRLLMHQAAASMQTNETTFWIPPDCLSLDPAGLGQRIMQGRRVTSKSGSMPQLFCGTGRFGGDNLPLQAA
jgi:hypothetical protein